MQVEDLEYGVETVFIVYLHLLTKLPMPQVPFNRQISKLFLYLWALTKIFFDPDHFPLFQVFLISFFSLFLMVGLATQFFQIDLIISAIHDNFWPKLNKYLKSREILSMLVVSLGFLLWWEMYIIQRNICF